MSRNASFYSENYDSHRMKISLIRQRGSTPPGSRNLGSVTEVGHCAAVGLPGFQSRLQVLFHKAGQLKMEAGSLFPHRKFTCDFRPSTWKLRGLQKHIFVRYELSRTSLAGFFERTLRKADAKQKL